MCSYHAYGVQQMLITLPCIFSLYSHDCLKRSLAHSAKYPLCKPNLTSEVGFVVPNFSC